MKKYFKTFLTLSLLIFLGSHLEAKVTYLNSLKGEEFEMGNLLEWSTLQEQNSKSFVVEKSIDGIDYTEVGSIDAAGNSSKENVYSYLDLGATDKKAFYRLRQVDADATISYSHTIVVSKAMTNNFAMINITSEIKEVMEVSYTSSIDSDMNIELLDEGGSILYSEMFRTKKGINDIALPMDAYPMGTYRVAFTMEMEREILTLKKVESTTEEPNMASKKNDKGTKN